MLSPGTIAQFIFSSEPFWKRPALFSPPGARFSLRASPIWNRLRKRPATKCVCASSKLIITPFGRSLKRKMPLFGSRPPSFCVNLPAIMRIKCIPAGVCPLRTHFFFRAFCPAAFLVSLSARPRKNAPKIIATRRGKLRKHPNRVNNVTCSFAATDKKTSSPSVDFLLSDFQNHRL